MCLYTTETEQFIEIIRKYPCVWNKEATVYKDNELKGKSWEQIAAKHGLQNGLYIQPFCNTVQKF